MTWRTPGCPAFAFQEGKLYGWIQASRIKAQVIAVGAMLDEWDPIGSGAPAGEYECMKGPLVSALHRGDSAAVISTWIDTELQDHFGLDSRPSAAENFADRLVAWFEQTKAASD
jgi:hypothetical protein